VTLSVAAPGDTNLSDATALTPVHAEFSDIGSRGIDYRSSH